MSNGNGNGTETTPTVAELLLERLSQGKRVSVDGIDVSNDDIMAFKKVLDSVADDEAIKANGGAFGALIRETAVPPSANGGFRYRFANPYEYRYPRWY